ncbi:MAG: hypothetical protein R2838_02915 [Caldilineaceae bacterium]
MKRHRGHRERDCRADHRPDGHLTATAEPALTATPVLTITPTLTVPPTLTATLMVTATPEASATVAQGLTPTRLPAPADAYARGG